jgi:hypothetical protein
VVTTLCGLLLLCQQPAVKPTTLSRIFQAKQKYTYDVSSHLGLESRPRGMETFMPEDFDLNYSFTAQVVQMKPDGIAVIRYLRPTMTEIQGETWDSPPKTKVEKVNWDFLLTVSPVNQILETVDQKKKKAPVKKPAMWMSPANAQQEGPDPIAQFVGDLYRLSLFVGPVETSLDFSPKLPLTEVVPGDTWKQTVGYQPQKLKGKPGMAVQRLDYTYTYRGKVTVGGKTFERVVASLQFNSDLADWARQYLGQDDEEPGPKLTRLPLHMHTDIEFNLDPKTFNTISAVAKSEGGFEVYLSDAPRNAIYERKLHGKTNLQMRSMTLVSS